MALARTDLTLQGSAAISFDTDGVPFIMDDSATHIITNDHSLFPGNLVPLQVHVDTIETSKSRQWYQGIICLKLIDDANIKHTYDIPGPIYNPALNFDLLGIPKLAEYFNDRNSLPGNNVDSDGTTVKSSGCCLSLIWDHGWHMRNFMHGDSTLPEMLLNQGSGYFSAFCLLIQRQCNGKIAFPFSSVFSISPQHQEDAALVIDDKDSEDKEDTTCTTKSNGYATTPSVADPVDKVEWYVRHPLPLLNFLPHHQLLPHLSPRRKIHSSLG